MIICSSQIWVVGSPLLPAPDLRRRRHPPPCGRAPRPLSRPLRQHHYILPTPPPTTRLMTDYQPPTFCFCTMLWRRGWLAAPLKYSLFWSGKRKRSSMVRFIALEEEGEVRRTFSVRRGGGPAGWGLPRRAATAAPAGHHGRPGRQPLQCLYLFPDGCPPARRLPRPPPPHHFSLPPPAPRPQENRPMFQEGVAASGG